MGDQVTQRDIFDQCQTGLQGHGKLMKSLNRIYKKTDHAEFVTDFFHHLKYAMVVFKREPAVERMIDFVSKFLISVGKGEEKEKEEDGEEEEEMDVFAGNKLLQETFDFLLKNHSARDRGVRFRCCQLINKLLSNLGPEAQIDDELYDRIYECMLERVKDKCPVVRYHAVLAMARLQDPRDEDCPVIKAYLFLLNLDPNADVRRAVLNYIAPSTKTLASIVGRTRDVKDTVRKASYEVFAEKIHVKALSIAVRLQLLNEGLNDRSDLVKQFCTGKLLPSWMRMFDGSILNLLKSLDVEDSTKICGNVVETVFKESNLADIVQDFKLLGDKMLIPEEELTSESVFYWQMICKYIHKQGTEGDEYLEKVLPNCVDFCGYLKKYVDELKTVNDPEVQLGREFIIEQLLLIASYMDTADSASRKAIENLLHGMVIADHVSHRLVKPLVQRICQLKGDSEQLVQYFAEVISEIREPITVVEKDLAEEQQRQLNLKVAGIRVKLNQYRDELEEAVKSQDFTKAAELEIKEISVAGIRVKLNQYRDELEEAVKSQDFTKAAELKTWIAELDQEKVQLLEDAEPAREEIRTERNDPLTIQKCQTIITEMLSSLKLNSVSPTLQMMIQTQIIPGIQNEDADVRNMAMQALGICCYFSKDLLVNYIPLFMQASQIDVELVRVTAIQVIFDLLQIYGLEVINTSEGSSSPSENESNTEDENPDAASSDEDKSQSSSAGIASKLVTIISSFLDGESSELRTSAAEGLAKLLLSGRVNSSKILSHLILLWYNPLSEDETHLRDCLGVFFPLFAFGSRTNQEIVEEAFLPTLKTLLNAPVTSPLAEVDVNNVAELLVPLTNSTLLSQNQNAADLSKDNPGHDNLSERVCNEILSDPTSSNVKLWIKILNQMQVSPDNEVVLKDLRILCYKMSKTITDKLCLRSLSKFQNQINELASKFVTNDDDLENIEIEPVQPPQETEVETEEETTVQTPKRKRVRGLYSQNMTLESEVMDLDLTQDVPSDIDASCLMRRASTVSLTPSRRSRQNTTELALDEDDIFLKPEAAKTKPKEATINKEKENKEANKENLEEVEEQEEEGEEPLNEPADKAAEKRKSDVEKTTPEKRARLSDKESPEKSRSRSKERRQRGAGKQNEKSAENSGSKSPKSPAKSAKDKAGRKSTEKDASKSPSTRRSPNKSADKSPNKSKTAESPSKSKAPAKGSTRSDKSPAKSPAKSPVKSPARSRAETSPKKASDDKNRRSTSSKRASSKSPEKRSSSKRKASGSPEGRSSKSPDKRQRSIDSTTSNPQLKRKAPAGRDSQSPVKKRSVSRDTEGSKPTAGDKGKGASNKNKTSPAKSPGKNDKQKDDGKKQPNKNVRQAQSKKPDEAPKPKSKAPAKSTSDDKKGDKSDKESEAASPRKTRGSLASIVVDTPEGTRRRPAAGRSPALSIPETPDSASTGSVRRLTRGKGNNQAAETPVLPTRSTRAMRGTPSTVSDNSPKPSPRTSTRATKTAAVDNTPKPSPRGGTRSTTTSSQETSSRASVRLTKMHTPDIAKAKAGLKSQQKGKDADTKKKAAEDKSIDDSMSSLASSPEARTTSRTRRSVILSDSSSPASQSESSKPKAPAKKPTRTDVSGNSTAATTTTDDDDHEEDQIRRRVKSFRKTAASKPSELRQSKLQKPLHSRVSSSKLPGRETSKTMTSVPTRTTARVASPKGAQRSIAATRKPSTPQSQRSDSEREEVFSSPGSSRSTRSSKASDITRGTRASNARMTSKSSASNLASLAKSKPRWK